MLLPANIEVANVEELFLSLLAGYRFWVGHYEKQHAGLDGSLV